MWRPFASTLVDHTFDGYRKKMDKIWASKPIPKPELTQKTQSSNFFFEISQTELQNRLTEFSNLQTKVSVQRKLIKKRDEQLKTSLKAQKKLQNEANELLKQERRQSIIKIREMATNKIHRHQSTKSQDYNTNFPSHLNKTVYLTQKDSSHQISSSVIN